MAAAAVAALVAASAAFAITGGAPDGNAHPYVGALLAQQAFSDGTWEECSGTLISPTVFLTAEHCDEGVSRVDVTFASSYVAGTSTTYSGTWHGDPGYQDPGESNGDPHDIAVVVLDKAVKGITPAKLPTLNQLATLSGGDPIVSVGYGAQAVTQGHGGKTFSYADIRYAATGSFTTLTQVYLKASMNPTHGDGGTCYGDSGGPNFIGNTNVIGGTTITGDFYCRSTNVDYRVDTQVARAFLGQFVTLP
jgi:V8-like Glu-specific endopeptidase